MQFKLVLFGAIIVGILLGGLSQLIQTNPSEIEIKSFYFDKQLYHSNELMNITLKVYSPDDMKDIEIRVYGIEDRQNRHKLDITKKINLTKGTNTLSLSHTTPSCFGCA